MSMNYFYAAPLVRKHASICTLGMATQSIVFLSGGIESYGPNVALRLFQHVSTIETVFDMKGPLFLDL